MFGLISTFKQRYISSFNKNISCSRLFEFKQIIVRDKTNPLFLVTIFYIIFVPSLIVGFLSFKFSSFIVFRNLVFLRSDQVDQRLLITYSSRMEPSFSWMDPNANLYHLSRPLIRNVRNETQSDGKSKDWFQRYIYIRLLYTSDISRSIYQNVSPLIQVSGYLPILLDNFQERGKRWSEGRGRWLVNNKKKRTKRSG